jgi:hypothetical protein
VAVLAASAGGCVGAARPAESHAIRNGYTYLGERWVDGGLDHDAIGVGHGDGRWNSILIVIENAPIEMYDMIVTFGDGGKFDPKTRLKFGPDTTSRMIDLPGRNRVIRRVDFHYGNIPGNGKAKVELWAR